MTKISKTTMCAIFIGVIPFANAPFSQVELDGSPATKCLQSVGSAHIWQVFQTKWGKAHEVAEGMKRGAEIANEIFGGSNLRILTNMSALLT